MINFGQFGTGIANILEGNCVGYAIAIYSGLDLEWSSGGGVAVVSPHTSMTSRSRMGCMSMCKTITGAAVVKQIGTINAGGSITLDSKIAPYLPNHWVRGPNVDKLTFRHLLTHNSGLTPVSGGPDPDPDVYANLQASIKNGTPKVPTPKYQNLHYCLFRIILPYLIKGAAYWDALHQTAPSATPLQLGLEYVNYVTEHILKLCNIDGVGVTASGALPYTLWYNPNDTSQHWQDGAQGAPVLRTGAGYWNMSAREFGRFIAHLSHGSIMTQARWNSMHENPVGDGAPAGLGLFVFPGEHGTYYGHNGGWTSGAGVGAYAGWMAYPDGTTAVMLVNSANTIGKEPEWDILKPCYDAAFEEGSLARRA
jgi:CubicO group peptidase (beta-lactamase class C family)